MKYEWNENKNRSNYEKHRIRFEEAQVIWMDPHALEFYDPERSISEDRFLRIISARKATTSEKDEYEKKL